MAFVAKYFSKEYLSKQIATLSKALESVSTNLSIIALLGLALIPMVPHRAASTLASPASPPPPVAVASTPVEVVRAKPVLVPQAPLQLEATLRLPPPVPDADAAEPPRSDASLRILARVSRERQRRAKQQSQPDSGDAGKAGAKTAAATTPVPDSKSEAGKTAGKAEPPVPDEWSEADIITALKDCLKRVAPLGAEIDIAPAVKHEQCGAPAPVMLKRIGSGASRVEFQPPPMLNCAMVASLHTWIEKTLQPTAQEVLGTSIVRLRGTGGYSCRNRNGSLAHSDRLSEHALANAIDIMGFVTADGRTIDVLNKWGMTARDLREQKERTAQEQKERAAEPKTAAAKMDNKEALDAARSAAKQAQKEATDAERAAAKAPRSKRKQLQAEAQRKKDEAERKADVVERLGEEAERRAEEVRRGSLRTAGLQKLGKGVDVKATDAKVSAKVTPTTATANDATRPSVEAAFLRRLHKGACGTFGTVLGPEANEAHRNHFHFDLAPRRRSAFCE
jgi:hypothetical protein